jgi:hypothetical protein
VARGCSFYGVLPHPLEVVYEAFKHIARTCSTRLFRAAGRRTADVLPGLSRCLRRSLAGRFNSRNLGARLVLHHAVRPTLIFDGYARISFGERAAMLREMAELTLPVLNRDFWLWVAGCSSPVPSSSRSSCITNP